jgi:hypothetical protein
MVVECRRSLEHQGFVVVCPASCVAKNAPKPADFGAAEGSTGHHLTGSILEPPRPTAAGTAPLPAAML